MRDKLAKICEISEGIIIGGIIILIPLYFNILTYITFEIDKIVLFRVLVELLFLVFITKVFVKEEVCLPKNKKFLAAVAALFVVQLISTVFSRHLSASFWGNYWRGFGLFTYVHLFVFAGIVFVSLKREALLRYFAAAAWSGGLVSLYGLMQSAGYDFLIWEEAIDGFQPRVSSALGQPNYLASYLLLVVPATIFLAMSQAKFYLRALYSAILVMEVWAIAITYSRSAWIGLALVSVLAVCSWLYCRQRKLFLVLVVAGSLLLSLGVYSIVHNPVTLSPDAGLTVAYRLRSVFNLDLNSLRFFYYRAAVGLIKEAPLFGHGLDTQAFSFYRYYEPTYAIYDSVNQYTDRSHNEILDVLFTTGFAGLTVWLVIFYFLWREIRRYFKQGSEWQQDKLLVGLLGLGLIALIVSLQFGFFTIVSAVYFWFYLAALFKISSFAEKEECLKVKLHPIILKFFLAVLFVCIAVLAWQANFKLALANYHYRQNRMAQLRGDFVEAFISWQKVLEVAPRAARETYYDYQYAAELLPGVLALPNNGQKLVSLENLANVVRVNVAADGMVESRLYLAMVLREIGRVRQQMGQADNENIEWRFSDELFAGLVEDAPGFSHFYYDWGNLYFYQAKYDEAEARYIKALASYPSLDHPAMNGRQRQLIKTEMLRVYKKLIEIKIIENDHDAAWRWLGEARALEPFDLELVLSADQLRLSEGKIDEVINSLKHLIVLYPASGDFYYQLAKLYQQQGDIPAARATAIAGLKASSNTELLEKLLRELGDERSKK